MDIHINLNDYETKKIIQSSIEKAISEYIEPIILEHLKTAISTEEVGKIILSKIQTCFEYSQYNTNREIHSLSGIIQNRIEEIASRITDEELKSILLKRFISKVT